jgi:hypothetical protein
MQRVDELVTARMRCESGPPGLEVHYDLRMMNRDDPSLPGELVANDSGFKSMLDAVGSVLQRLLRQPRGPIEAIEIVFDDILIGNFTLEEFQHKPKVVMEKYAAGFNRYNRLRARATGRVERVEAPAKTVAPVARLTISGSERTQFDYVIMVDGRDDALAENTRFMFMANAIEDAVTKLRSLGDEVAGTITSLKVCLEGMRPSTFTLTQLERNPDAVAKRLQDKLDKVYNG